MQKSRQAAAEVALAVARTSRASSPEGTAVWNFGFGANLDPWKLTQKRGITPLETVAGSVKGMRVAFNHRGGFGNLMPAVGAPPVSLCPLVSQPDVHGICLLLSFDDFSTLAGMEHQYLATEVDVETYDGRTITALAFVTAPAFVTADPDLLPTDRYLGLIRRGAKQMNIQSEYISWLDQIPTTPDGSRGPQYYNTPSGNTPSGSTLRKKQKKQKKSADRTNQTACDAVAETVIGSLIPKPKPKQNEQKPQKTKRSRNKKVKGSTAEDAAQQCAALIGIKPAGFAICEDELFVCHPNQQSVLSYSIDQLKGHQQQRGSVKGHLCFGGHSAGAGAEQLSRPWRVACTQEGVLVCDRNNARVQLWVSGAKEGVTVAGGHGPGAETNQLDQPVGVSVHSESGDIYISDRANHRVMKWSVGATEGEVVAGGNGWGGGLDQLACPAACHVSSDSSLYVTDEANNRVVKWTQGATEGVVVAGGEGAGAGTTQLYHPLGLWVSEDQTSLLVGDSLNMRVQRHQLGEVHQVSSVVTSLQGQPMCVGVDHTGSVWVSDSLSVYCTDLETQRQVIAATPHVAVEKNESKVGIVSMYKPNSGWGFIVDEEGVKYFAHHSDIMHARVLSGYPRLVKNEKVKFEVRRDSKWTVRATAITGPDGCPVQFEYR